MKSIKVLLSYGVILWILTYGYKRINVPSIKKGNTTTKTLLKIVDGIVGSLILIFMALLGGIHRFLWEEAPPGPINSMIFLGILIAFRCLLNLNRRLGEESLEKLKNAFSVITPLITAVTSTALISLFISTVFFVDTSDLIYKVPEKVASQIFLLNVTVLLGGFGLFVCLFWAVVAESSRAEANGLRLKVWFMLASFILTLAAVLPVSLGLIATQFILLIVEHIG